jgi:glycerophosphoryl diester phosphodiesterase
MQKFLWQFCFIVLFTAGVGAQATFDIEGHRGCRGLYPENTIVAFIEAVKLGVNTLEMDVVVSRDGKLVVSHDPYFSPEFCNFPEGQPTDADAQKFSRIYNMTYEQIKSYDCGSRINPKFPEQKKMFAAKPLLSEVIDTVENFILKNHLPAVQYNIETKSTPEGDDIDQPKPVVFAKLLYDMLKQKNILGKSIIQSFDIRTLQIVHQTDSTVATALLIADIDSFDKNIHQLGFKPTIYSPNLILVNEKLISKCHEQKIKIIPWTINDTDKMIKLKQQGVDGLITDYPDRAIKVLR